MSTQTSLDLPRRSRWTSIAVAAALLAASAIGIAALLGNPAHAIPTADAVAGRRTALSHGPASDASVPSADAVFETRVPPDFNAAPTF